MGLGGVGRGWGRVVDAWVGKVSGGKGFEEGWFCGW